MSNRVRVSIAYGELWAEIVADGVSYAPDAVDDMVAQCTRAFSVSIAELRGHGVIQTWNDGEEDEDLVEGLMLEEDSGTDE